MRLLRECLRNWKNWERKSFGWRGLTGQSFRSVDVRYKGQGYELNVPYGPGMAAQFHDLHQRRYGFANEMRALEVVNVRVADGERRRGPSEPVAQPLQEGDGSHALIEMRPVTLTVDFRRHVSTIARCCVREITLLVRPSSPNIALPQYCRRATFCAWTVCGNLVIEVH